MKWSWRWMIGDYVPVESGLRHSERRQLLNPIMRDRVGIAIPALFGGMAGLAFASVLHVGMSFAPFEVAFLFMMILATILNFAGGFLIVRRIASPTYAELRRRGIDLCEVCNYDLRGSGEAKVCPECGAERLPTLPESGQ